ncbi:hypothetical protein [Exiguobacterium undae]
MKVSQQYYIITELSYQTNEFEDGFDPRDEYISERNKIKVAIRKDLNEAILENIIDISTTIERDGNNPLPYRDFSISIRYVYEIVDGQSDDEIKDTLKDSKILNVIKQQSRDVIRMITSLDYQPSIVTQPVEIDNISYI